jgi:hypothetical protein
MEAPSCDVFNYGGIGMIAVGAVITGIRQTNTYRRDFSTTGTAIGFLGAFAIILGAASFASGQKRTGCRS